MQGSDKPDESSSQESDSQAGSSHAFRFQELDIWIRATDAAVRLFRVADKVESRRFYRFAEQLRAAGLSMPNNIAEGSGSESRKEFANLLNMARRSVYENASMLLVFAREGLIEEKERAEILGELEALSRMIQRFRESLRR